MTSIEKAHPLASKPICTPQLYDANFQGIDQSSVFIFQVVTGFWKTDRHHLYFCLFKALQIMQPVLLFGKSINKNFNYCLTKEILRDTYVLVRFLMFKHSGSIYFTHKSVFQI